MKLFTVREAAESLGISLGLVYALCARKRLRHERYGLGRGIIKIPEDAIDEFRRSVTVGKPDEADAGTAATPISLKKVTV